MERKIETRCLHFEEDEGKVTHYGAISYPIYQTATYAHAGVGRSTGYDYSRLQNPTRERSDSSDSLPLSCGLLKVNLNGLTF